MRRMAASAPSPPTATRPRHFLRYSLRGLLIFLTLACVGVWYWFRVPYATEIIHPKDSGFFWREKSGPVLLGKTIERFRRVLRGNPVREGRTEHFDIAGHRVREENWLEGQPHGLWRTWYTNGKIRDQGRFQLGRRVGSWERFDEQGQLTSRKLFDNGDPHGVWEWFEKGKSVRTVQFDHGEVTEIDRRHFDDHLGRSYRLKQIDDPRIYDALSRPAQVDFFGTPLKHVADFLAENYKINVCLDRNSLQASNVPVDLRIAAEEDHATLGAMLVLLFEPHGLAASYRFGMIWITTMDDAKNWVDRTGVAEVLTSPPTEASPGDLSKIAAAFQGPAEFDFVDTPAKNAIEFIAEYYRVPMICEVGDDHQPVNSNVRGISLQHALGALCDQYDLRIRWKDRKTLVIEPQEGAENEARWAGKK